MRLGFQLDRPLIDERVNIVEGPVTVTLDAQPITQPLVLLASVEEVGGSRVDGLQDLECIDSSAIVFGSPSASTSWSI